MADANDFTFAEERSFQNITWYDYCVTLPIKSFYEYDSLQTCICVEEIVHIQQI